MVTSPRAFLMLLLCLVTVHLEARATPAVPAPSAPPQGSPAVSFQPTSLNFGTQPVGVTTAPLSVTLTNTGTATLNISSVSIAGKSRGDYKLTSATTCKSGTQVTAGGNCTISVTFTPARGGIRPASISVADDAAGSPQQVPLTGTGAAPAVSFSPPSLIFGDQLTNTTSASQTITVSNPGLAPLQIQNFAVSGANAGDFAQTNNCGSSLAAGANCTVTVTFTPSLGWTRMGTILLTDNALGSPHLMGLSGTGVGNGTLALSTSSLTFAGQLLGTTSSVQTVTLNNTGAMPVALAGIAATGDYALRADATNPCGATLAAGGQCKVDVTFTPSGGGTRTGYITVSLTDPFGLQTVTLTGTGAIPAPVAVSPRSASITFTQTLQYQASISGVPTSNVTWSVDGVVGGNASVGTITSSGLYTPPAAAGSHTVTASNNLKPAQKASVPVVVSNYAGTFTHHNDVARTGQNNNEMALTTGNVNRTQFGKLFSYPVDGYTYAEPLYVPNVNVSGSGFHNVVYVATEHDSIFAFDADNPQSGSLCPGSSTAHCLWKTSFINAGAGVTSIPKQDVEVGVDLVPEVGITGTPVIDPANETLYVMVRTKEVSGSTASYVQRLHALDITTGAEKTNSPVVIQASVKGTGSGNDGHGNVPFDPLRQNNRAALLLLNGVVYIAWASLEDIAPYHGWIIGYDENTLQQVSVFNDTPNGSDGGIWQGGGGLLADASGNIFFATGNGTFDVFKGGSDYGVGFLKLTPTGNTLPVTDYFVPFNQAYMNLELINQDLASGGPMLLPDQAGPFPHLALACGKTGTLYLMNRDSLGGYNTAGDQIVQALYFTIGVASLPSGNWGTIAYFQNQIYVGGIKDHLKAYPISQSLLSAGPLSMGPEVFGYPGPTPVISSNGSLNGIVWIVQSDASAQGGPAVLRALDAANISHELYNSTQAGKRDTAGPAVKFSTPTVANGKVFVATQTELDVYGLLP